MLGDVKGSTAVKTSLSPDIGTSAPADAWDSPKVSTSMPSRAVALGASSSVGDMNIGEAEQRLLRSSGRGSYNKFMTLHRRRRHKPPTRHLEKHHRALLDDLYNGPTQCVLSQVGVWGFNAFALDSVCGGRPVSVLCVYLLHKYGLIQHFRFDTVTVWKCFSLIEDGYHASNPYHNAIHAADVTQAMHCYLQEEKIYQHLTPLEMLAALVAAVCHDLDHPGVNQPFLIATDNHLAALYRNLSVLENHHWRCAMGCLWESGLLDSWDPEDVTALQDMIRSLILATDITRQQEFLTRFLRYLDGGTFNMEEPDHRHFSLQIALKCADICNPCRPWEVSQKWSRKICDEFYRQGDYERQLHLPVTPLCDRYVMSVAKIQTGFIKYVVSPLFDVWDRWLKTSLSASMVTNMNQNLAHWEEQLLQETGPSTTPATTATTQVTVDAPDSPVQNPVEGAEEDTEEVDGGTTPSSSGDSHQSVLGSLENVSRSLQLGRRHSVPLNLPRLVPRTIMRRESLPEGGCQPLVVETVTMGGISLTSLSSHVTETNSTLTSETLLPEPSITTMGGVSNGRPRPVSRLTRRMSLPPLWPQQTRARTLQTLQPLSPTPSEDSSSRAGTRENSPYDNESERRLGTASNGGSGGGGGGSYPPSGNNDSDCGGNGVCSGNGGESAKSGDCCDPLLGGQGCHPTRSDPPVTSAVRDCASSVHSRKSVPSYHQGATFLHSDCLDNLMYVRSLGGKGLVRRASLDSTSISSKREFLDRLMHESSKYARVDRTDSELDKENLAPRESTICREHHQQQQQVPLGKTRAWRSLNCDDENVCDPREKLMKPGIYKLNHSQGNLYAHGRRGSAPLLRPEEMWGGLRGGAERPDHHYLSLRRGSAPSQPIHQGLHSESGPEVTASSRTPLTSTENLPFAEHIGSNPSRLRGRRGSMPFDLPGLDIAFEPLKLKDQPEKRFSRRGSGGVEVLPSIVGHSLPTGPCGGFGTSGGGCGGTVLPPLMPHYNQDYHRGSGGLELLAGLWRSHLETDSLVLGDSDLCSQSSGGQTPSTPGATPSPRHPLPHLHRRGSLPTDLFYSGDLSVWDYEGT